MTQLLVGQLLNGLIIGTLYGIIALGVTLTFGITGIVNFALGVFMTLGAYVAWFMTDRMGMPYPVSVLGAVAVTALAGLVADQTMFRFTRNNLQHPTHRALTELGKAVLTVFLCRYLSSEALRREIHEGLQWSRTGTAPTASSTTARVASSPATNARTRSSRCSPCTCCRSAWCW